MHDGGFFRFQKIDGPPGCLGIMTLQKILVAECFIGQRIMKDVVTGMIFPPQFLPDAVGQDEILLRQAEPVEQGP